MRNIKTVLLFIGFLIVSSVNFAGQMPPNSILGFGTQLIKDSNKILIEQGINEGYRLFDTAELYDNIDLISAQIMATNKRDNLYVIYKITPPKTEQDFENIKTNIAARVKNLGTIDCLMLHSIEEFFDEINSDLAQKLLAHIRSLIKTSKVMSFGLSNIGGRFQEIIEEFNKHELKVNIIENHFNNNTLHFFPTKEIISYSKKNSIKFVAYGALGGHKGAGVCKALCAVAQPLVFFDIVRHPAIIALSSKYDVDPMMLILAYESKKFDVYHIPTTTREERLKSNFINFNKAFKALTIEDLSVISFEIGRAKPDEFLSIPALLRNANSFRSRLRLIESLLATDSQLIKTINNTKFIFDENNLNINIFINKLLYIYEEAKKYGKEEELEKLLEEYNKIIKAHPSQRGKAIIKNIFNLDTNEAFRPLLEELISDLKIGISQLLLIYAHRFSLEDFSDPHKIWPTRKIIVIDPAREKIIKFDAKPPIKPRELLDMLRAYGIEEDIIYDLGGKYDLTGIDTNQDLSSQKDGIFNSMNNWVAVGENNAEWIDIIGSYDPFILKYMYE